jgi:Ion channel
MVFSLGFICIILFATILATTGTIVSHFVYDIAGRLRFKILLKKEVMTVIWGLFWCSWQIFMTAMFMEWTNRRLFTSIRWQDAYWFAYISTTTIGLGDYYLTPEVIYTVDLLYFSLSYLFGFVLLSTFLTELGNALAQYVPDVSEELGKRLQYVGPIPYLLDGARLDETIRHETIRQLEQTKNDERRPRARLDFDT